jgi:hypothetical protein
MRLRQWVTEWRAYRAHTPAHRLGSPRIGDPHQLIHPTAPPLPPARPQHAIADRITPDAWWHGGAA